MYYNPCVCVFMCVPVQSPAPWAGPPSFTCLTKMVSIGSRRFRCLPGNEREREREHWSHGEEAVQSEVGHITLELEIQLQEHCGTAPDVLQLFTCAVIFLFSMENPKQEEPC